MRGKILLTIMTLLVGGLAGCTDDTATPTTEEPASIVTDPTDYSYLENQTDGSGWHVHDYWRGQDRLTVLEASDGCSSCTVWYDGDHGATIASLRPGLDDVVPQGTAWLHVTADWNIESGNHAGVGLWVKTANMADPEFVGEVHKGQTLTLNSTNDDNDPPHQRLSLWEFELRALHSEGEENTEITNFEGTLRVEAERGLPIPAWPPHPDFWGGADEITLHESTRSVTYNAEAVFFYFCAGCLGYHPPDDGKIVPYDAESVQVTVATQGTSLPPTLGLRYHGADSWDYQNATPEGTAADHTTSITWDLPLDGNADSPYAKQSLWEMYLYNDQPTPARFWQGEYTITVKAVK